VEASEHLEVRRILSGWSTWVGSNSWPSQVLPWVVRSGR
jgi:hypothetical protein